MAVQSYSWSLLVLVIVMVASFPGFLMAHSQRMVTHALMEVGCDTDMQCATITRLICEHGQQTVCEELRASPYTE